MYGGSTSSGGRWSLGAKTYRAPTEQERLREAQDRLARENERRKLHEIKHQEKHIRQQRELARETARVNERAVGMELGARGSPLLGAGMGAGFAGRSPRMRASSFSGIPSLGAPIGGLGGASAARERERLAMERRALEDTRRREAELARVRAQRQALEVEAARRQRTASAMRNERAALAVANERILASPRMSPRLSPRLGPIGGGLLPGALPGAGGLRRSSSWSGGPGLSPRIGGQSPRVVPVPVPVPVASPRIGGYGGGYGGLRSRTPSPSRLVLSPRIGARTPSPRVVNYNTFNVSPRLRGLDGVPGGYGGVGGLGALDDLHLGGRTPIVDPVVLGDGGYDGGLFGGGAMPGQITTHHHHDFVVTDLDHEPGRAIVQDLGVVEGLSGMDAYLSEDDKLSLAIANLTANAQSLGANAVLQVETGEDVGGQILVRGRAAVLS
ncbi:hypothetical protein NBRC10513v2_000123 [Rhodotorula toruloides]|uniref:Uncharacterized protein n=1 Tax=Rhodotorula toruloides TaxID=5286 RepID=A0A0K3CAK1_RHOTO